MHADSSTLEIIAHLCIAFLFLYRGVVAIPDFDEHLSLFRERRVPFPRLALVCGLAVMFIGGASVALGYRTAIGAALLIVFTVLANYIYHNFWDMKEAQRRQTHTWIFCNNIGVTGGLLLVMAASTGAA